MVHVGSPPTAPLDSHQTTGNQLLGVTDHRFALDFQMLGQTDNAGKALVFLPSVLEKQDEGQFGTVGQAFKGKEVVWDNSKSVPEKRLINDDLGVGANQVYGDHAHRGRAFSTTSHRVPRGLRQTWASEGRTLSLFPFPTGDCK